MSIQPPWVVMRWRVGRLDGSQFRSPAIIVGMVVYLCLASWRQAWRADSVMPAAWVSVAPPTLPYRRKIMICSVLARSTWEDPILPD